MIAFLTGSSVALSSSDSRPFAAKHAGTCGLTGMQFWANEQVRYIGGLLASDRCIGAWHFSNRGELCASDWQRPADVCDADLALCLRGDHVDVMNARGVVQSFEVRDGRFVGAIGRGSKSPGQMVALLRTAAALRVSASCKPGVRCVRSPDLCRTCSANY
jgi:hypothetical protein